MKVVLDFGPIGSDAKFKLRRYAGLFIVCFIIAVASVWDLSFLLSLKGTYNTVGAFRFRPSGWRHAYPVDTHRYKGSVSIIGQTPS